MKKILITALLASVSLMAANSGEGKKSGAFSSIDGAALYKQQCSLCHGEKGQKIPSGATGVLAGRDAVRLALEIRSYRDQDKGVGTYTMHKSSQVMKDETSSLSDKEVSALAKYINSMK